jgi:hypothetical protein
MNFGDQGEHDEERKRSAPYSPNVSPCPVKKMTRSVYEGAEKKEVTRLEGIPEEESNFAKASPGSLAVRRKVVARRPMKEKGAKSCSTKDLSTAEQSSVGELPELSSPKQEFHVSILRQTQGTREWIDRSSGLLTLSATTGHLKVIIPETKKLILNATVPTVLNPINVTILATETVPDFTWMTVLHDTSGVAVGRRPFALKFASFQKFMLFLGIFNAASIRETNQDKGKSAISNSTIGNRSAHELKKSASDKSLGDSSNNEDDDFNPPSQDIFEDARNLAHKLLKEGVNEDE